MGRFFLTQGHMVSRVSSLPTTSPSQFPQLATRPPSAGKPRLFLLFFLAAGRLFSIRLCILGAAAAKRVSRDDFTVDAYGNRQPASASRPRPVSQPAGLFQAQPPRQPPALSSEAAATRPHSRGPGGGGGGGASLSQSRSFGDERAAGYKTWSQADAHYFFQQQKPSGFGAASAWNLHDPRGADGGRPDLDAGYKSDQEMNHEAVNRYGPRMRRLGAGRYACDLGMGKTRLLDLIPSPSNHRRRRQAKLANIRDGYTSDWEGTPPRDGAGTKPRKYATDGYASDLEGRRATRGKIPRIMSNGDE